MKVFDAVHDADGRTDGWLWCTGDRVTVVNGVSRLFTHRRERTKRTSCRHGSTTFSLCHSLFVLCLIGCQSTVMPACACPLLWLSFSFFFCYICPSIYFPSLPHPSFLSFAITACPSASTVAAGSWYTTVRTCCWDNSLIDVRFVSLHK